MEALYLFSRRINLGPIEKDFSISESDAQQIEKFSKIKEIKKLLEIIPGSEIVSIKNLKDKN